MSLFGECSRVGCSRPRARNPRTSAIHDYCSLRCSRIARLGTEDDGTFQVLLFKQFSICQSTGSSFQPSPCYGSTHVNASIYTHTDRYTGTPWVTLALVCKPLV